MVIITAPIKTDRDSLVELPGPAQVGEVAPRLQGDLPSLGILLHKLLLNFEGKCRLVDSLWRWR